MRDFALGALTPRGNRRVIYNSDPSNTTRHLSEPATPEELRQVVRNYAAKGAIDTLVQEIWHQGWSEFWRTDKCGYDARAQHQRLVPMMDDGVMPIEVYIDECHQREMEFIAGFRMNDRHGHNADWFAQLARDRPEWILHGYEPSSKRTTDERSYDLGCALDYSVAEVRDWLFSLMAEVAHRFDIDGIEFNYTRLPACFPRGTAEERHAIMTGFVRRVRAMLDEVGGHKGRKLVLGVRVLQHLESCLKMGFDIPTWIGDGLIDYIVPGDIGFTDFNPRFEDFVRLARESDCYVYPQIQAMLGYHHRDLVQTPEHCRAAVRNFYGAGADGFSTQNYFEVEAYATLKELRDPEHIGDRHYVYYPIWGPNRSAQAGYEGDFPYHTEEIVLDRRRPGERGEFRFRICEHLPADAEISGAELLFRPDIATGDEIAIDINGAAMPAEQISYEWYADRPPLGRFALSSPPAVYGDNYLGIELLQSASGAVGEIVVSEVEVVAKAAR